MNLLPVNEECDTATVTGSTHSEKLLTSSYCSCISNWFAVSGESKDKTAAENKTKSTLNWVAQELANVFSIFVAGAKFRKYNGHSAHVTNVRFSIDGMNLISTGGADHSIFQWQVIPEGYKEEAEEMTSVVGGTHAESNDEASDSDLSDVNPLDSDVEEVCSQRCFMPNVFNTFWPTCPFYTP